MRQNFQFQNVKSIYVYVVVHFYAFHRKTQIKWCISFKFLKENEKNYVDLYIYCEFNYPILFMCTFVYVLRHYVL